MRLSNRSYPHPVVGNGDDVPKAAFQATYEYESDKQFYYISVTVMCSSDSIGKLLKKGLASYVLHVECGNTLFRQAFDFSGPTTRINIPASRLNGAVEVNCLIRATADVLKYHVDGAHEDYGTTTFDLRTGDIIGVAGGQHFEAENQDTLRHIGSIMVIEESVKPDEHPMEVNFLTDKIRIALHKTDFNLYKELKTNQLLASHLTTTIVLPVLTEALHLIRGNSQQFEGLKWYRNLKGRLEDEKLSDSEEYLHAAQVLLDMPIRRAFTAASKYIQGVQ